MSVLKGAFESGADRRTKEWLSRCDLDDVSRVMPLMRTISNIFTKHFTEQFVKLSSGVGSSVIFSRDFLME